MFTDLFGAPPPPTIETETVTVLDISTRRTEAEVFKLVRTFQKVLDDSPELRARLEYFWPSTEFSDRVLFSIAHDVPKAGNPLWPPDPNELFPGDERENVGEQGEEESDESFDAVLGKRGGKRKRRKKRPVTTEPKCVEWLGLINEVNRFAAIKLAMPATFESWVTWANRVVVFLFGTIPTYEVPEDFIRVLKPPEGGPFPMRCKNPRCIRLSHIDYLPPELRDAMPQQRYLTAPQDLTSHTTSSAALSGRNRSSDKRVGFDVDGASGTASSSAYPIASASSSVYPLSRAVTRMNGQESGELPEQKKKKKKKKKRGSDSEEEEVTTTAPTTKRVVWSPGFD